MALCMRFGVIATFAGPIVPVINPGTARLSPPITEIYCRPFTAYVMVLTVTGPREWSPQHLQALCIERAKLRLRSPQKIKPPAVASTAPVDGTSPFIQRWTSPVERFTFASPLRCKRRISARAWSSHTAFSSAALSVYSFSFCRLIEAVIDEGNIKRVRHRAVCRGPIASRVEEADGMAVSGLVMILSLLIVALPVFTSISERMKSGVS